MKHDNITMYGSFMCNSSKISLCDDIGLFITFCINETLVDDICWLMINKKITLGSQLGELLNSIEFIDGTLIGNQKPWKNKAHKTWFNGHKKIYSMNNIFVLDPNCMFIYIDINYFNFYHDTLLSFAILEFKEIGVNSLHIE